MKRFHKTRQVIVVVAAMGLVAAAQGQNIEGSSHDINGYVGTTGTVAIPQSQICLPCHTPHNAMQGDIQQVLWNHAETTETFDMYGGGTLAGTALNPESRMCLSCHDGVTAVDNYGGNGGVIKMLAGSDANLGTDLSDDHPINVTYPPAGQATQYNDPPLGSVEISASSTVECGSCHNPHDPGTGPTAPFLRDTLTNSALCTNCHIK